MTNIACKEKVFSEENRFQKEKLRLYQIKWLVLKMRILHRIKVGLLIWVLGKESIHAKLNTISSKVSINQKLLTLKNLPKKKVDFLNKIKIWETFLLMRY